MNLLRRVAALFRRSSIDREIDEELRAHLAMCAENNVAVGMSPETAARDARLRFGNPTATRGRVEHVDIALSLDSVWRDIRYAIRDYVNALMFAIRHHNARARHRSQHRHLPTPQRSPHAQPAHRAP